MSAKNVYVPPHRKNLPNQNRPDSRVSSGSPPRNNSPPSYVRPRKTRQRSFWGTPNAQLVILWMTIPIFFFFLSRSCAFFFSFLVFSGGTKTRKAFLILLPGRRARDPAVLLTKSEGPIKENSTTTPTETTIINRGVGMQRLCLGLPIGALWPLRSSFICLNSWRE
jgi:hypothetical protein